MSYNKGLLYDYHVTCLRTPSTACHFLNLREEQSSETTKEFFSTCLSELSIVNYRIPYHLHDDQPTPWSSTEEKNNLNRKTLPTLGKLPKWENPHLREQ